MTTDTRNIFSFKIWVWSNTLQPWGIYNWNLFKNAHNSLKHKHHSHHDEGPINVEVGGSQLQSIPWAATWTTASHPPAFHSQMQIGHFDTFFRRPTKIEWHGDKYRCLSISLHMTICSCCNPWATWELSAAWCHQSVSLLCSEPTECYEMRSAKISNLQFLLVTMCFSHVSTLKENPHDGWWCRQGCNTVQ